MVEVGLMDMKSEIHLIRPGIQSVSEVLEAFPYKKE